MKEIGQKERMSSPAFSVISLIVSLSIIAVIAFAVITWVQYSTAAAKRFQCANNLRQIYQYWIMYLDNMCNN